MTIIKNDINESLSSYLIFLRRNHFQRNLISFRPPKLTINLKNTLFLLHHFKILEIVRDELTI